MRTMSEGRILIIGLGQIGYHDAKYMTGLGLPVDGFDIDQRAVQRALGDGVITRPAADFKGYDYYVVAISTHDPADMSEPYLDGLYDVAGRLRDEGKRGSVVAIESTVPPGSSRKVMNIMGHRLHVSHVPHRFFMAERDTHGVKQLRVLGGCEACCGEAALRLYKDVLNIPVYPVGSVVYAELSKVVENTHRFLEIAFAEELKIFCDVYGLNFEELRDAVNTKWNEGLLEARAGIGGHCLPKDSQMYLHIASRVLDQSLIETAKQVDGSYVRHISPGHGVQRLADLVKADASGEGEVADPRRLLVSKKALDE
jgi:UDP-N-acetyl-D-mannosaminuronic acid dehydrogenase